MMPGKRSFQVPELLDSFRSFPVSLMFTSTLQALICRFPSHPDGGFGFVDPLRYVIVSALATTPCLYCYISRLPAFPSSLTDR